MKTATKKRVKNAAGFFAGGQFHPIRKPKFAVVKGKKVTSGAALEDLRDKYNEFTAGDYDSADERRERKARNLVTSEQTLRNQIENMLMRDLSGGEKLGKTLVQFVRAEGGFKTTRNDAGELKFLTFKESKKRGLVHDKPGKGKTLDYMFQASREAGYAVSSINDLLDKLDDEIRTGRGIYATGGYGDYRENPAKKRMAKQATAAQIKQTAATLAKLYPGKSAAAIVKTLQSDKGRQTATKRPAKKNPATVENGLWKRFVARHKAGSAYKKQLRLEAAADRAKTKRSKHEAAARKNPTRRKSAAQMSFDFAGEQPSFFDQNKHTAVMLYADDLQKPKFAALRQTNRDGSDTYYFDKATGKRYVVRTNPATVKKVKNHYQILLSNGQYLRDAAEKIVKIHSIKQAREVAAKTKVSQADELAWLNNLALQQNPSLTAGLAKTHIKNKAAKFLEVHGLNKFAANVRAGKDVPTQLSLALPFLPKGVQPRLKQFISTARRVNPMHPLAIFSNLAVGAASALQVHDYIKKRPAAKKNPAKKPAAKKNPVKIPTRKAFEMFQGRPATNMRLMEKSAHAPNKLDSLGNLVEIKLADGQVLDFMRVKNGKTVYPFELTMNGSATRLWIAGGKIARRNPALSEKQIDLIAPIEHIVYATYKPHIEGDEVIRHYIHALGEETGEMPMLGADKEGYPVIYGGAYTIEDRGIVN